MGSESPGPTPAQRVFIYFLFVFVTVVALAVPFYNRTTPELAGIPFFYWFQVAWILAGAFATALAYRLKL